MADLYTSYSTSLTLRDAGAPQDGRYVRRAHAPDAPVIEAWGSRLAEQSPEHFVACFRADEIVEALGASLDIMEQVGTNGDDWQVSVSTREARFHGRASTPVEALAQAWLAVLRGAK